jgi:hypothetical protein
MCHAGIPVIGANEAYTHLGVPVGIDVEGAQAKQWETILATCKEKVDKILRAHKL